MRKTILFLIITITTFLEIYSAFSKIQKNDEVIKHPDLSIPLKAIFPSELSESSGLIFTDGKLWTHNDKGGKPCIYNIDTITGAIRQTVYIDNYPNIDWEDITADNDNIYVGDFGNNYGIRKDLKILIIKKSEIGAYKSIHVKAQCINFNYADQQTYKWNTNNNFDCEAMISVGDSIFLFSKDRGDGFTKLYALSKNLLKQTVIPCQSFDTKGRICGATYSSEINELVLIGYMPGTTKSFIWRFNYFNKTNFFHGTYNRYEINPEITHWKTEGITFETGNRVFISCESTSDQKSALFSLNLN